jgi:O-antigen ligase
VRGAWSVFVGTDFDHRSAVIMFCSCTGLCWFWECNCRAFFVSMALRSSHFRTDHTLITKKSLPIQAFKSFIKGTASYLNLPLWLNSVVFSCFWLLPPPLGIFWFRSTGEHISLGDPETCFVCTMHLTQILKQKWAFL